MEKDIDRLGLERRKSVRTQKRKKYILHLFLNVSYTLIKQLIASPIFFKLGLENS